MGVELLDVFCSLHIGYLHEVIRRISVLWMSIFSKHERIAAHKPAWSTRPGQRLDELALVSLHDAMSWP